MRRPVTVAGKAVDVTEYSDALLMFILKAECPEKYRERQEVKHTGDMNEWAEIIKLSRVLEGQEVWFENCFKLSQTTGRPRGSPRSQPTRALAGKSAKGPGRVRDSMCLRLHAASAQSRQTASACSMTVTTASSRRSGG